MKIAPQKGHRHNLIRAAHYDDTKKYEKQRMRTAHNKARHIKKAKELRDAARHKREAKRLLLLGDSGSAFSPHGCSDLGCV